MDEGRETFTIVCVVFAFFMMTISMIIPVIYFGRVCYRQITITTTLTVPLSQHDMEAQ